LRDQPRLLDLFCCAGGASVGYSRAGFEVVGVDIAPQRRYPFEFIQADALTLDPAFLAGFDAIHASPPCQAYTRAQRLQKRQHPDLIAPVRRMLEAAGAPYIIENVPGSPLMVERSFLLCGKMFPELRVYRHRFFETSFPAFAPYHPRHDEAQVKMGRRVTDGEFIQVVGNFSGVEYARKAMGIDWMTRDELREAIPPAYTQFIGKQLIAHLASLEQREAA
jgi:DNA (cytosine-5)-methyltransferase 1